MNNTHSPENKNRAPKPYDGKACAKCNLNGTAKKWTLIFKYSYKARLCVACVESLGGMENSRAWLEKNSSFDSKGNLYFPGVIK